MEYPIIFILVLFFDNLYDLFNDEEMKTDLANKIGKIVEISTSVKLK